MSAQFIEPVPEFHDNDHHVHHQPTDLKAPESHNRAPLPTLSNDRIIDGNRQPLFEPSHRQGIGSPSNAKSLRVPDGTNVKIGSRSREQHRSRQPSSKSSHSIASSMNSKNPRSSESDAQSPNNGDLEMSITSSDNVVIPKITHVVHTPSIGQVTRTILTNKDPTFEAVSTTIGTHSNQDDISVFESQTTSSNIRPDTRNRQNPLPSWSIQNRRNRTRNFERKRSQKQKRSTAVEEEEAMPRYYLVPINSTDHHHFAVGERSGLITTTR